MGPRRRGKGAAAAARTAAIQAVKRQRQQDEDDDYYDQHNNHNGNGSSTGNQQATGNHGGKAANGKTSALASASGGCAGSSGHGASALALQADSEPPPLIDDDASIIDNCLHCHRYANDVQVRCDECHAYICQTCHWCHEFQANHEIRVCDRCDAFYCRNCDEMDQCDDCGEVVCASCSTLLSCKFCGGGLCEECATACGRCGIVLCSRDAKFAVDCDTCRLSYCLVCLASGSKDPCVRCGHRPSKRMEQLVHLRLKSIYKAFKQSSRSPGSKDGGKINFSSNPPEFITDDADDDGVLGDVDNPHFLLQAAASAASSSAKASRNHHYSSHHHSHSNHHHHHQSSTHASCDPDEKDASSGAVLTTTDQAKELVDRYMEEKERADAAAQDLLAQLEEEEKALKSKKSKKKRKKERQQAKREEEKPEPSPPPSPPPKPEPKPKAKEKPQQQKEQKQPKVKDEQPQSNVKLPEPSPAPESARKTTTNQGLSSKKNKPTTPPKQTPDHEPGPQIMDSGGEEWMVSKNKHSKATEAEDSEVNALEQRLADLIDCSDTEGIEDLLFNLKGIPGRSAIRKNAKKALKRIRQAAADLAAAKAASEAAAAAKTKANASAYATKPETPANSQPLRRDGGIRTTGTRAEPTKTEFVMRVSPFMVGWIIGRGGQRVRDLMEESGAKIWIDQNITNPNDQRSVYVNGTQKCVDHASRLLKDLIANGPPTAEPPPPASMPVHFPNAATPTSPVQHSQVGNLPGVAAADDLRSAVSRVVPAPPMHPAALPKVAPPGPTSAGDTLHVIECEPRFVPLLIGRRGWAIKNIQDTSGARVDIDQSTSPRQIRISGQDASVQMAARMVNDVLQYPHAQLRLEEQHQRQEELEPSSPPSSLIMTGDPKSSISASSSLSSTPEPSIPNNKTSYAPMQHGVLFPREYDVGGMAAVNNGGFPAPPPATRIPVLPPPALGRPIPSPAHDVPLYGGSLSAMVAPHQPNYHLPPVYNQQPLSPQRQQQTGLAFGSPAHGPSKLNPNPFAEDFPGPASPAYLNHNNGLNPGNLTGSVSPDAVQWNQPDPLFTTTPTRPSNAYGHGEVKLSSGLPVNAAPSIVGNNPFASSVNDFRDDSHIIDSLFAPQGPGAMDNAQSLLNGLNGLSINNNDEEGMWGTSLNSSWKPQDDPIAQSSSNMDNSALLAGLQSLNTGLNGISGDDYGASESRFYSWSSSNNNGDNRNNQSVGHA